MWAHIRKTMDTTTKFLEAMFPYGMLRKIQRSLDLSTHAASIEPNFVKEWLPLPPILVVNIYNECQ